MKSILQSEKKCYISETTEGLHKHHIYGGSNRKWSEKYGLWVWLRADLHNMSNQGVHFNKELDDFFKRLGQIKFEKTHSRDEFMRIFGRNWL